MKTTLVLRMKGLAITLALAVMALAGADAGSSVAAAEMATAQRAVAAVHDLIHRGEVDEGAVLRVLVKHGNRASFLGVNEALRDEWEEATGILLDIGLMSQGPSLETVQERTEADLAVVRNREYPDLIQHGLIHELSPLLERFAMDLPADGDTGFFLRDAQSAHGGQPVAVPADGDIALLYLRQDLLEDEQEQRRFRECYGYELRPPRTWSEYADQLAFFHRPEAEFYGSVEQRDPDEAWMYWLPRFAAQDAPNAYLFDDDMRPRIDSEAGIEATRSYLRTLDYAPEGIAERGAGYDFTLPYFSRGEAYSMVITVAGAKLFNRADARITGDYSVHPLPGTEVDGELVRRTTLIYGNNLVVLADSDQPELAFLYAMWLTSPEQSLRSVLVPGGFVDPYRWHHLDDPAVREVYGSGPLEALRDSIPYTVPAGTGLPGNREYIAALNEALGRASRGELSARQAMEQTAEQWEAITERHGRSEQQVHWQRQRALYPGEDDE